MIQYTEQGNIKHITVRATSVLEACQKFSKGFPNCEVLAVSLTTIYCNCTTFTSAPELNVELKMFVCKQCNCPIKN